MASEYSYVLQWTYYFSSANKMDKEQEILNSYRAMDAETQQEALEIMSALARDFPRSPPKTTLKLIHSVNVYPIPLQAPDDGPKPLLTGRGK